jgi:translation initiation factor IF-1
VPRENAIAVEGIVVEVLGNGLVRAELVNGHRLLAHAARRNRAQAAQLAAGDKVRLEMSPFDMSVGRVLF